MLGQQPDGQRLQPEFDEQTAAQGDTQGGSSLESITAHRSVGQRHRFNLSGLYLRGRSHVHRSLQARTVAFVVFMALLVAVVFSVVSMVSVRSSLVEQVTAQSRSDFSNLVGKAQVSLDSSDISANSQYQRLVNDLASTLQKDGASNLIGIYIWGRSTSSNDLIPVSTEPTYVSVVSSDIRSSVASTRNTTVFYQPVDLLNYSNQSVPGAVLGTRLQFGAVGDLEIFAVYSYENQQQSLTQIQISLLVVCLMLSVMMGLMIWMVMRRIIRPVERVAQAAETLASGELDARVVVNRSDEIGTLQRSFNGMADSLNQKIGELEAAGASQRRFVSDVSHELRTPVTTMRMASDLLESRKNSFDSSTKRTVELLSGQIGRFQEMLADLLEISRYDAGYTSLDFADIDVCEVVQTAVEQVQSIASAKGVALDVCLPAEPVYAHIDARRITRIIRNLLVNGIDFADARPIEVRVAVNSIAVVFSVRDYGIGIEQEQLEHIFDRFWRADPSRSRTTGGSGLGLSIALADAQVHGGSIQVHSCLGLGTWFLVSVPRESTQEELNAGQLPVSFVSDVTDMHVQGDFGIQTDIAESQGRKPE